MRHALSCSVCCFFKRFCMKCLALIPAVDGTTGGGQGIDFGARTLRPNWVRPLLTGLKIELALPTLFGLAGPS